MTGNDKQSTNKNPAKFAKRSRTTTTTKKSLNFHLFFIP